ncbi:class I SAM-dependent methyltransferase [Acaryochloris sp. IP29b_bin.137]|uniref:class I SAM-dependent methyltransferase n=1 Tax=Acaryochloris sp. IP29b_bin.137 TaxID=2969217 RepID=UPI002633756E|nr:class I SAM-dependent methyltransferase [Acaryochloris sp. IP29b_bin.137]
MEHLLDQKTFCSVYEQFICRGTFNEIPEYYPRYRSRYQALLQAYIAYASGRTQRILDIGGGQLALLCKALWDDDAHAVDIGGPHLDYLASMGVKTTQWNLCSDEPIFEAEFDFIFFSEVIEHLPIPGHLALEKLRIALKPGGILICSTPNLYRLRNVVYMILGKQIYDYFRMPEDQGLGHVLEYSIDHLQWQFERAGFQVNQLQYCQMHHLPENLVFRLMYLLGAPLFWVPRFRDNLLAIAQAP